ncbi:hypothetical protein JOC77_004095 [Peribacillus deserti]|uniref:Spore coat protein n=1 Tax=Peribacillus deserti TaxID=673318 RepID=A0ABS2QNM6_9BACI|nr:hypothetical protein [Peribacillus deserti]MBM7694620.1 hypothetical protein [Peribacillus deserti]
MYSQPVHYQQPAYHQTLRNGEDERFFPLLPFVAGLAVGPLLFNRPYYYPPYPVYPAYPAYPPPAPYPYY